MYVLTLQKKKKKKKSMNFMYVAQRIVHYADGINARFIDKSSVLLVDCSFCAMEMQALHHTNCGIASYC